MFLVLYNSRIYFLFICIFKIVKSRKTFKKKIIDFELQTLGSDPDTN